MTVRATIEIEGKDAGAKRLVDDVIKRVETLDRVAAKAKPVGPSERDVRTATASAESLAVLEGRYKALSQAAEEMSAAQGGVSPQLKDMIGQQVEYAKTVGASSDVVQRWSDLHTTVLSGATQQATAATKEQAAATASQGNTATAAGQQFADLTKRIEELERALKKANDESGKGAPATKKLGDTAGTAAVEFNKLAKRILTVAAAFTAVRGAQRLAAVVLSLVGRLDDLSQRTGLSVAVLSGLDIAAKKSGRSVDDVATAVESLSGRLTDIALGRGRLAADALRRIGLSADQLQGLDARTQLQLVADALAQYEDGADKAALANDLFGGSGARLLPVLRSLAGAGMDDFAAQAEELNLAFTPQQVQNVKAFNDAVAQLHLTILGLVADLTSGSIESATEAIRILTGLPDALRSVKAQADALIAPGGIVGRVLFGPAGELSDAAMRELPDALKSTVFGPLFRTLKVLDIALKQSKERRDELAGAVPIGEITERRKLPPPGDQGAEERAALLALRRSRLEALVATAQGEVEIAIDRNLALERENQAAFDRGLVSLEQFLQERQRLLVDSAAKEIGLLRTQLEIEERKPLDLEGKSDTERAIALQERDNRVRQLKVDIIRAQGRAAAENAALEADAAAISDRLIRDRLGFEQRLAAAKGETAVAATIAIEQEVGAYDLLLRQLGVVDDARARETQALRAALTGATDLAQAQERVGVILARQSDATTRITNQVTAGQISERQAREQTIAVHRQTIDALSEELRAIEKIAQASGNEQAIRGAQELKGRILELSDAMQQVADEGLRLQNALLDTAESTLTGILTGLGTQIRTIGDALLVIVQNVQRVFAAALARIIIERLQEGLLSTTVDVAAETVDAGGAVVAAGALSAAGSVVDKAAGNTLTSAAALGASGLVVQNAAQQLQVAAAAIAGSAALLAAAGTGAGAASAGSEAGMISSFFGFASGGYVRGPGTGTSDSIPAWLSHREFVEPARSVEYYGADLFEALRQLAIPRDFLESMVSGTRPVSVISRAQVRSHSVNSAARYAQGGLVGRGSGNGGGIESSLNATIGLEDGLVLRHLESAAGEQAVIRVLQRNPGALRAALGRG